MSIGTAHQANPDQPLPPTARVTPVLHPVVHVRSATEPVLAGEATHRSVQPSPAAHTVLAVSDALLQLPVSTLQAHVRLWTATAQDQHHHHHHTRAKVSVDRGMSQECMASEPAMALASGPCSSRPRVCIVQALRRPQTQHSYPTILYAGLQHQL